jgi:hypothetical protein
MKRSFTRRSWLLAATLIAVLSAAAGGAYAATQGGARTSTVTSTRVVVNLVLFGGQSQTIGSAGPLSIQAVCNSGSPNTAEYRLTTTKSGTSMDAGPEDDDFGPGSINWRGPESNYEANYSNGAANWHQFAIYNSSVELMGGNNQNSDGACQFGGVFTFVTSGDISAPPA